MSVEPVWPVDLEDNYDATTLRAPWGQRLNDGFADLGGPWQTYQPVLSGGLVVDDAARVEGSWKRFGDWAWIRQTWSITGDDTLDSAAEIVTTLPFDVAAVGVISLSGWGSAINTDSPADRRDFECRLSGQKAALYTPYVSGTTEFRGDSTIFSDFPVAVTLTMWVLLNSTVSATGGTYDNDLAATYTPSATAPSEAYHEKINVNCALPGTETVSTAQFLFEGTGGTALTATSPVRRYSRVGDLGFLQFEWAGSVTGSTTTDAWYAALPSGWTLADSGDQVLGPAEVSGGSTGTALMGWVGPEYVTGVSDGTKVGMWANRNNSGAIDPTRVQGGATGWTGSSVVFKTGLLVCRLT